MADEKPRQSVREILPSRRPAITYTKEHDGTRYHISVGYDRAAKPKEVFIRGTKTGSHMDDLLDDAGVIISLALQNGITATQLRRSTGNSIIDEVLNLLEHG